MENLFLEIPDRQSTDSQLVLATVTRTSGSTPQKPGSSALFGSNGLAAGTVGGGIVEGKIQKLALQAGLSKISGHYHFNLANDISKKEEAICGGQISVLLDAGLRDSLSVFGQLKQSLSDRIPGVLITLVTGIAEAKVRIVRHWISESSEPEISGELLGKIKSEATRLISGKNPAGFIEMEPGITVGEESTICFLQPFFPPDQLVIAGAGHIGRALAHLGSRLGFEVTVIDDRPEFANVENIPEADHIIVREIGEAMDEIVTGENTYVVIVTRGHKDDASALRPCIGRNLAYTGMIGSKSKISAMRTDFIENGYATHDQWNKIHAPVGLAIKSQTVEEIAVSIAAELVLVRNSRR